MNEGVKVSIAGIAFRLDAGAYEVLKAYLDRLEEGYAKQPEGREIIADIEARLAELLLDRQPEEQVVSEALARSVVEQLGLPDDLDETEPVTGRIPKRLHRNPDGALLGGVCSGIAAYFHIDTVWVRLGFFLPLFLLILCTALGLDGDVEDFFAILFGLCVLLYPVLWIIVPMARTPRQKLEMSGRRVTASAIRQSFEQDASAMPSSPRRQRAAGVWADLFYGLGRVLLVLLKVIVFCALLALGAIIVGCLVCIVILLSSSELFGFGYLQEALQGMVGITPVLYVILLLVAVLLPLVLLGYFLICLLLGRSCNRTFMTVLGVLWILLAVYLSVVSLRNGDTLREAPFRMEERWERDRGRWEDAWEERWEERWDERREPVGPGAPQWREIRSDKPGPAPAADRNLLLN